MAPPPELPKKLETITPPWCEGAEAANAEALGPAPTPFALTVPHSTRRATHLYEELRHVDELDNRHLKTRVDALSEEILHWQETDSETIHGLSKVIVIKYGETAIRVIHRVWDLHLVYNRAPKIPGDDAGPFDQSSWLATIRDTVLYRMHVKDAEDYKVRSHGLQNNGSIYVTDVLVQEHRDRVERAAKEKEVLTAMFEELTQENLIELPGFKATALGVAPLLALRQCGETVEEFYKISDEKEDILENNDESDMRYYQSFQLWHIAARAAMGWEPRRVGTVQDVLNMYCYDILRRRRFEKRKRNSELRHQLEAILGDTRGDQVGFGSEDDAEEDNQEEENIEEEDSDGPGEPTDTESGSSDEEEEDSSDDDRPIFGHYID
ncbi:unnamed protein product [Fusarium graminearum]|uniref:Uncharacterized protein n=1 Tax=Gibberella zeae TaxID=5518 RepID=A0A2H3G559_GIBZA|nr:hypothetical protein HG531_007683 [Fusarium graminearum]PCD18722.1 hypothetical protein FGRA07_06475 [Fusarium graminearum]CAF3560572.1 unnamed protein product [Fusarium graminearum]CAG1959355.1 unnamed protein product [Fusarium graminearum]CAG1960878.1 unnamed protein product [Fusarium graminearum]